MSARNRVANYADMASEAIETMNAKITKQYGQGEIGYICRIARVINRQRGDLYDLGPLYMRRKQ